jgi:hypothetical protein
MGTIAEHGGWLVENPQRRNAAHPETFLLPDAESIEGVGPGWGVRALLWFVDDADGAKLPQCERMWALVVARSSAALRCRLASPPVSAYAPLDMGSVIELRPTDLIDVRAPEPDWREHAALLKAFADGDEAFARYQARRRAGERPGRDAD